MRDIAKFGKRNDGTSHRDFLRGIVTHAITMLVLAGACQT
jgi:hypothetical protein